MVVTKLKKIVFCCRKFSLLNSITVFFLTVIVSNEIKRRHCFQNEKNILESECG